MATCCSNCSRPLTVINKNNGLTRTSVESLRWVTTQRRCWKVRASMMNSSGGSSEFATRMEQAWLISQQPKPVMCSCCNSKGRVECEWCQGTGFFILGNNMLCEVPSKNTTCVICAGKGSTCCADCKGTGFLAKWLTKPPISK